MDAITKFKEAALALQQEEVYKNYASARAAYDGDTSMQDNLGRFRLARLNLDAEMQKDDADRDEDKITSLNAEIGSLYNDILACPSMEALSSARAEVESFVEYVNAILNTAIDGGDPMEAQPPEPAGCGGGCSSCSGCH